MGTDTTTTDSAKKKPLLDLDSLLERPLVSVDGVPYELVTPDELTIVEHRRLLKLGQRLEALESKEDPTEADEQEHQEVLGALCRKVLVAPASVIEGLSRANRASIALAFSQLRMMTALRMAGALVGTGHQMVKAVASGSLPEPQTTGESSPTA